VILLGGEFLFPLFVRFLNFLGHKKILQQRQAITA
jgi:hypothetical protein